MEENKIVSRLSRVGIFGNILLAAFKLIAGLLGKSGAMVSDAVHSLSDVFATLIAWIGVRLSRQEEDVEHPYGHERLECAASLVLGLILAATGLGIGWGGVRKLFWERGSIEVPTMLPLIAALVSIAVKEGMYHYTMHYAKKLDSAAFRADAWHHRSDAISSVGSFIGIGMALILKVAYDISHDALSKMLDTSCGNDLEQELRAFIAAQSGVERVDLLRTRQFGSKIYVDLEIAVDEEISLLDAHGIAERVHSAVERAFPRVKHVMIHVNPLEERQT